MQSLKWVNSCLMTIVGVHSQEKSFQGGLCDGFSVISFNDFVIKIEVPYQILLWLMRAFIFHFILEQWFSKCFDIVTPGSAVVDHPCPYPIPLQLREVNVKKNIGMLSPKRVGMRTLPAQINGLKFIFGCIRLPLIPSSYVFCQVDAQSERKQK